ncbi:MULTISPECIES: flavin reductase family protein [Planomonospora]|uniref:flavin reductase family protein n=1 Tax=Planomonospora TaxID=1998 RepID=UPI0019C8C7EB|nr:MULTISPECIES: flavin reductase family protein [Planomonospora]GGL55437.1 flavin reductase [Planomonospora parontospora subsp. antibiotica]GII19969.1 flavin reductase [Planomonospora parontospora subsp. antibiotica]
MSLVDAQQFRDAMTLIAGPITIVTTIDREGRRWGFTASSVTSGSLSPPLVLVGLSRTSSCHEALVSSSEFVINVLGDQHRDLALKFAAHGVDRFADSDFAVWPGARLPYLPDAHASFRCVRWGTVPIGDHDLLVGALAEIRSGGPGKALLWYRRGFHTPG